MALRLPLRWSVSGFEEAAAGWRRSLHPQGLSDSMCQATPVEATTESVEAATPATSESNHPCDQWLRKQPQRVEAPRQPGASISRWGRSRCRRISAGTQPASIQTMCQATSLKRCWKQQQRVSECLEESPQRPRALRKQPDQVGTPRPRRDSHHSRPLLMPAPWEALARVRLRIRAVTATRCAAQPLEEEILPAQDALASDVARTLPAAQPVPVYATLRVRPDQGGALLQNATEERARLYRNSSNGS